MLTFERPLKFTDHSNFSAAKPSASSAEIVKAGAEQSDAPKLVFGAMVFGALQGAVVVGGVSALSAALFSIGLPKDSTIQYEAALKANGFLIVAHGPVDEMARAKAILETANATHLEIHEDVKGVIALPSGPVGQHAPAS